MKTCELLRLFDHGLLDILVNNMKKDKMDEWTSLSLKIIFILSKFRSIEFKCGEKNILFEKLRALDFSNKLQVISTMSGK